MFDDITSVYKVPEVKEVLAEVKALENYKITFFTTGLD